MLNILQNKRQETNNKAKENTNAISTEVCSSYSEIVQYNIHQCFKSWTALRDFSYLTLDPETNKRRTGVKSKGSKGKGIFYSSVFWNDSDILWNRNLSTFYSSLLNPASVVYQGSAWKIIENDDASTRGTANFYGSMCSGFVGKVSGCPIYYTTAEMNMLPERFEKWEYTGPEAVEMGTILLSQNHTAMIYDVVNDNRGRIEKIAVAEEAKPCARITFYTILEFEELIRKKGYLLGKFTDVIPEKLPEIEYASDVIPEFGDRTWYKLGDEIWLYISNGSQVLYFRKESDQTYSRVLLSSLEVKHVNEVDVYNITELIKEPTEYFFTTDIKSETPCIISIINTGTLAIDNDNQTAKLSGFSDNLIPLYYQVNYLTKKGKKHNRYSFTYPAPESYVSHYDIGNKYLLNGSVEFEFEKPFIHPPKTVGDELLYKGYSIIVHYKNIFGMPSVHSFYINDINDIS